MPGLFDKIAKAAQQTATAAQEKAAEGKIRLDMRNLSGKLDEQAQALGHLMFRQHRGETIPDEEYTKILNEMMRFESERQAKEVELEDLSRPAGAPAPVPGPASAPVRAPAQAANAITCSCGAVVAAGTKFCPECGSKLV